MVFALILMLVFVLAFTILVNKMLNTSLPRWCILLYVAVSQLIAAGLASCATSAYYLDHLYFTW